jgi:Xaa-Pro aminopeptidase
MICRRERALEIAARAGADVLVAAHPATVAWLTGYACEIETGPSPFALTPLAIVAPGAAPVLVASEVDAAAADALAVETIPYTGFTLGPLEPIAGARQALEHALGGRRAATELGSLPAALAAGLDVVDASDEILRARAVKDADEITALRAAIAVCDAGQRAAREAAEAGRTELEVWAAVHAATNEAAGGRTPILADLVSGERTAEGGGSPAGRRLAAGDPVLCDLVPRVGGYWGDSCATFTVAGEASPALRAAPARVRAALARAVELVRPGARARDVDAAIRDGLDYPHHTGHGVGTAYHEEPRVVPDAGAVLEPGMVVALEPGVYGDGFGVRLEQVVLVTPDGAEILSGHSLDL